MREIAPQAESAVLTKDNMLRSLHSDIARVPFINELGERVFPAEVSLGEKGCLIVDMTDGSRFSLAINSITYTKTRRGRGVANATSRPPALNLTNL
jgi:hypothetical protein